MATINTDFEDIIDFDVEETEKETKGLPLDVAWCGGSSKRGCGAKFSLLRVKRVGGFFICPVCGRMN